MALLIVRLHSFQSRIAQRNTRHLSPASLPRCDRPAVQSPVQLSHFLAVGDNLSGVRLPNDNLAGVLLSHLPEVLSERRCLMIEGRARLREVGILYRSALYPLSEDGVAINHVLGAANYRPLLENEELMARLIRTKWL